MIAKTRNVVAASAAVLGLGLGTGLLAYYVGMQPGSSRGADELRYVPANVVLVAAVDVHAVMTSPLREKLRSMVPAGKRRAQEELTEQTGINLDTDIDRVIMANAKSGSDSQKGSGLVLASGRFDVVRIEALMRAKGGRVEEQGGKRLIIGQPSAGHPTLSLALMEPGLIAFGSEELVRSAIALSAGGASVTTNEAIMTQVRSLASGDAWVVGRFDELASTTTAFPAGVGDKLPPIQWLSASVSVDSGIRGVIRAETRDDESANSLRDVVRGVVAFARLQSGRYPLVDTALRSVTLGGSGKSVNLGFDVPTEVFDALAALGSATPTVQ